MWSWDAVSLGAGRGVLRPCRRENAFCLEALGISGVTGSPPDPRSPHSLCPPTPQPSPRWSVSQRGLNQKAQPNTPWRVRAPTHHLPPGMVTSEIAHSDLTLLSDPPAPGWCAPPPPVPGTGCDITAANRTNVWHNYLFPFHRRKTDAQ